MNRGMEKHLLPILRECKVLASCMIDYVSAMAYSCSFSLSLIHHLTHYESSASTASCLMLSGMWAPSSSSPAASSLFHMTLYSWLYGLLGLTASSALASGFLSGNLTSGSKEGTRFGGHGAVSQYMNKLYDNEPLHNAQRKLSKSIEGLGITAAEAALRWAMYHSALAGGDGIILGASKESQIIESVPSLLIDVV